MKKSRWKAWAAAVMILFVGIALGVSLTLRFGLNLARGMVLAREGSPAPIDNGLAHLEASWADTLHLTPEQRALIHEELQRSKPELQRFRADTVERLQVVLGEMVQRCEKPLDEQQREALRRHVKSRLDLFGLHLPLSNKGEPAKDAGRSQAAP